MIDQLEQTTKQFVADDVELRQMHASGNVALTPRFSNSDYIQTVEKLKEQLQQGNIYEVTFCQEFYNDSANINPFETYIKLNANTRAPMSCFYKKENQFIISSSPERFMCRRENKIYSQPIKGTAPRSSSREEDEWLKDNLQNSEKERSENIIRAFRKYYDS